MQNQNGQRLLTVEEIAELIHVHPQTIYKLIYSKRIPFIKKPGIGYRFRREDIERWLAEDMSMPAKTA